MKHILGYVRRAINDFNMIEEYMKKNNYLCNNEFLTKCEYKKYGFRAVNKMFKNKQQS